MHSSVILLDIGLMTMLLFVAIAIVRMRSLFGIVMLQGVYSLLCAAWFVTLDAVDVAFTEAAVGAGISTVLMLAAMLLADRQSAPVPVRKQLAPLLVVIFTAAALFYAIGDMPAYGDATSPANSYVGAEYIIQTPKDIDIPNVVTAVLASYRSYDTMGETVVIFMAGLGVLLLLGLNGNAGKWRAEPQSRRAARSVAPDAKILHEDELPETSPESEEAFKAKPVRKRKASNTKKPSARKPKPKSKSGGTA